VSEALREVRGLSGRADRFARRTHFGLHTRLRSEHNAGVARRRSINQGLQGAFNFADLTRTTSTIEVVRGPQSTLYGPRALAGVIQIFTNKRGDSGATFAAEGGS